MKILLLEDEQKVASMIHRGLESYGFEFSIAMDGYTALKMAGQNNYDLIILDVMVPGLNGLEVCRNIRKSDPNVAILILSALGTTEDIIAGFDSVADDYMVKPFNLGELRVRMQSLIRRSRRNPSSENIITLADLTVNFDTMEVTRANKPVVLTATEFKLLEYLLKNRRKVLQRLEILENVWGSEYDPGTNVVDVYINYLRKKIDKEHSTKLIHTMIGVGYTMRN